jgi:hypothetical protein
MIIFFIYLVNITKKIIVFKYFKKFILFFKIWKRPIKLHIKMLLRLVTETLIIMIVTICMILCV